MTNSEMISMLVMLLAFFIVALIVVIIILIVMGIKNKLNKKAKKEKEEVINKKEVKTKEVTFKSYTRESIYKFMQFDKIEDNMIVQKGGKRYIMIVECQGVNYDLMSKMEKVAVEEGFLQFLNSLKHPIQLYVQSRTVNLGNSINTYRDRVESFKTELDKMQMELTKMRSDPQYTQEEIYKYNYEIIKQMNLYEYGRDIINNTEKMNLNKNVLMKKYYVVIPYYVDEANNEELSKDEIANLAFSELYTRAQSVIRTLYMCEVNGKILNSSELVELLYVAYNRDDSEIFEVERALKQGAEDIYSTAPDVFEKKIRALDEVIEKEARERAEWALQEVKSQKQAIAEAKQKNIEDLINNMAKEILEENKAFIGRKAVEESKKVIDKTKEGGSEKNEEKTKRTRRITKASN